MTEPKITRRNIRDLQPAEVNPNKGTPRGVPAIIDSLNYNGFGRPMVADKDGEMIGGSHTLQALVDAGFDEVIEIETDGTIPIVHKRTDLDLTTDAKARALQIADNRTTILGYEQDDILVAELLNQIGAEDARLVQAAGFDDADVKALLDSLTPPTKDDPGAQVDRAGELQTKWGVARGDVWQIGKHRLMCGDSTSAEDVGRLMGGESAKLAWFDPPFGIDLKPQRGLTDEILNDGNEAARKIWAKFLPLLCNALTDTAHVFLCQDWTEFNWTLPLVRQYFTLKSKVVWFKNVWGIGYYTRPQHEDIIYCWKGTPAPPSDPVADVWQVAREPAPDHAAEKPPELSHIAIDTFSIRGDIVIDWFGGVGGSMVACENLNRQCRMMELEPKYCSVILERMTTLTGLEPQRITNASRTQNEV